MLLVLAVFFISQAEAASVDAELAKEVARSLFYERSASVNDYSALQALVIETSRKQDTALYHVVSINNQWHAVISADDAVYPVISYSFHPYPRKNHPPAYTAWMENVREQILYALRNNLQADQNITQEWNYYSEPQNIDKSQVKAVAPLLSSSWHQGPPYNNDCPYSLTSVYPNSHVPVGCVAVAMGQIMNYWQYPVAGSGSNYYSSNYGNEYADFGSTTYDWTNMPAYVTTSSPAVEQAAVAELLYHCGVSVDMMYGDSSSGAYMASAAFALMNYFNYLPNLTVEYKNTTSNWDARIKTDIDNGLPILYAGSGPGGGHAFVLDGYQGSSNNHYHFNWGWDSTFNNYCYLSNLNPAGTSASFSLSQQAIFGIEPLNSLQVSTQSVLLSSQASSSQSITVTASTNWTISTSASWLNISPASGSGNGSITFTANSANTNSSGRTAIATLSGNGISHMITITQQGTQTASSSGWFSPTEDLIFDFYGTSSYFSLYVNPLLVDSLMTYITSSNQKSSISTQHVGAVCDPYSFMYSNPLNDTSGYVLDSLYIAGIYDVVNSSYTDTLIFEIVHDQPGTSPAFMGVFIPMTPDTLWFSPPEFSGSSVNAGWEARLTDPGTIVVKKPLTVSDSSNLIHYVDIPDINLGAGEVVGVSVTFKPGYSYSPGDTMYDYNAGTAIHNSFRYYLYSTTSPAVNPNLFLDPYNDLGRYNNSYSIYREGRYSTYPNPLLNSIMMPQTDDGSLIGFKLGTGTSSTLSVSPNNISLARTASSSQPAVITTGGSWTASTSNSWLSVAPGSGNGNDTIVISATSANTSTNPRLGTVTVTGSGTTKTIAVTQQAAQLDIIPLNIILSHTANANQVAVVSSNVSWTAGTGTSWLSVSPSSGSNNGNITITATSANTGATSRTGTVTVIGSGITRTVSVTQEAATLNVSQQTISIGASANMSKSVAVSSNIAWTATTPTPWLSISPAGSTGNDSIVITTVSANSGSAIRTGTVLVSGSGINHTITVNQEVSQLTVNPQNISLGASANASHTVSINSNITWTATANNTWLSVGPAGGANNGSLVITALSANTGGSARIGTVTLSGNGLTEIINVTQEAAQLNLSPQSITLGNNAGASQTVTLSSNISWSANSGTYWLDVTPAGGSNNSTLTVTANEANSSATSRSGNITVTGNGLTQSISITQEGSQLNVNPQSITLSDTAWSSEVVSINSNFPWTVSSPQSWLMVSPASGTANSNISITANSANTGTTVRTGSVMVQGNGLSETISVTQETSVGLEELAQQQLINIYPNPNTGNFYLKLDYTAAPKLELSIFSMQGQLIHNESITTGNGNHVHEVRLEKLPAGMYYLDVKADNYSERKKLIIYRK